MSELVEAGTALIQASVTPITRRTYADEPSFWVGTSIGRLRVDPWMKILGRLDSLKFRYWASSWGWLFRHIVLGSNMRRFRFLSKRSIKLSARRLRIILVRAHVCGL